MNTYIYFIYYSHTSHTSTVCCTYRIVVISPAYLYFRRWMSRGVGYKKKLIEIYSYCLALILYILSRENKFTTVSSFICVALACVCVCVRNFVLLYNMYIISFIALLLHLTLVFKPLMEKIPWKCQVWMLCVMMRSRIRKVHK